MSKRKFNDNNGEEEEEEEEEEEKYINISSIHDKIIYCLQCNSYLIYIKGLSIPKENHFSSCDNCESSHIQNVYIDEAKIYFDSKNITEKTKLIGADFSNIKRRCYSRKLV